MVTYLNIQLHQLRDGSNASVTNSDPLTRAAFKAQSVQSPDLTALAVLSYDAQSNCLFHS
jgi:hypothetical protein